MLSIHLTNAARVKYPAALLRSKLDAPSACCGVFDCLHKGEVVHMNGAESISIIGGADGPTAIFLAGKLSAGFKIGIIIFVIAVLALAGCMVLWKPKVRTKYRFIRLSIGNLLIHLMDGLVTFVNTPNLAREGNILVRRFGMGWGALFTANFIGFILIVLMTWCFNRYEHVQIPSKSVFDYYMKLLYGEDYKPKWFWYKISKNFRPKFAMYSYGLYWGLTAGSPAFVIGWIWDMLGIRLPWWRSTWIAFFISILVAFGCIYKWAEEGYKLSCETQTQ